jgi:hypothetical protein
VPGVIATPTYIQVTRDPIVDDVTYIDRMVDMYQEAKQHKSHLAGEWRRNLRLVTNRAASATPVAAGVRANEVAATIDARIGWMLDQEITCSITAACDPYSLFALSQMTLATQLEAVINSNFATQHWYTQVAQMLWHASLYGMGVMKVGWDAGMEGGLGNVVMNATNPWCLYLDPWAASLDDAQYIFEVHTMTLNEIERRFPGVSEALIDSAYRRGDQTTDHIPPNELSARQRAAWLIPVDAGEGATTWGPAGGAPRHIGFQTKGINVYECWRRENLRMTRPVMDPGTGEVHDEEVVVDRWRVTVYAGNHVLLDELAENLFGFDRHPYVRYVDTEMGELYGAPIMRDLAPCQLALNQLLAMAQNNVIFTGNPMLVAVKGSGVDRSSFTAQPGRVFDVNAGAQAQGQRPDWLSPPNLPSSVMELIQLWREEIERLSGLQGSQRGEVPSGRATDKQVAATQEAGFVRIRSAVRNLEACLSRCYEMAANLICLNYDTQRFVAIVGADGEASSVRLAAQHFYGATGEKDAKGKLKIQPLRFALTVNAGSQKPTSRGARMQEALNLKAADVVDDLFVLEAARVPHAEAVLSRKHAEDQAKAQAAAAAHQQARGPGTGHPH